MRRVALQFRADLRDADTEVTRLLEVLRPPRRPQQLPVGNEPPVMLREDADDLELGRREEHYRASAGHPPAGEIDDQLPDLERRAPAACN